MTSTSLGSGETKLETVISYILVSGVLISLVLELVGIILFYIHYKNFKILESGSVFVKGQNFFLYITSLFQGRYSPNIEFLIMIVGLVVLILTPYVRVITSIIYFISKKNLKYILLTLFVFTFLTISLIIH